MLNYKEISAEFSKKLAEFDEAKLTNWIELDENRQLSEKLLNVETTSLSLLTEDKEVKI